jgi:membrane protease YdiL (CAAX protease family)
MSQQLIEIFLMACLSFPPFFELYKHILKNKPVFIKIAIIIVYWGTAVATKTLAALAGIIYLYFAYYIKQGQDEACDDTDIWHIDIKTSIKVILMSAGARAAISLIHLIYIIILIRLVNYNIKPQEIITYYSNADIIYKIILFLEIVFIAPIVEEYVFRYFLYGRIFSERMPRAVAMVLTAALFTASHFNVSGIPAFFGIGLFCAFLYSKKGYWAAVIAHSTSNLITLLFL